MHEEHFKDFDAFAESVRHLDCTMMLQNQVRRRRYVVLVHARRARLSA